KRKSAGTGEQHEQSQAHSHASLFDGGRAIPVQSATLTNERRLPDGRRQVGALGWVVPRAGSRTSAFGKTSRCRAYGVVRGRGNKLRGQEGRDMRRLIPAITVLGVLVVVVVGQAAGVGGSTPTTPSAATPRWVTHVARYSGGLSGTVRAVYAARGQSGAVNASAKAGSKPDV